MKAHILWWWCAAAVLFPLGIFAIVKPEKIQEWALRQDNWPFQADVESPTFVRRQRIVGVVAIAMALFFAYAAYANR